MAFKRSFAVLFVLATSVLAFPHGDDESKGEPTCGEKEFYYSAKDCCLPHGGLLHPPSPPHDKSCPPSNWYWHIGKSCCVPKHPLRKNPPPPQCKSGYGWDKATQCCEPVTPTSTYTPHKPSETPKGGDGDYGPPGSDDHYKKSHRGGSKRHQKRSAPAPCPRGYAACPVTGLSGYEYECLDTAVELRSCGGCASTGQGQDCKTISKSWNVGCEVGSCVVYTCESGYKVSKDGKSCTKN